MASFNFGNVGNIVEMAQHANANVDTGPVADSGTFNFLGQDFGDFVLNKDRMNTIYGSNSDFIWGQKWGNTKTRVVA